MSATITAPRPGGAPLPGARPGHFVGIDGARAIAAFGVVIVHVTFLSGFVFRSPLGPLFARADIGVEVFFLLSGFLLYRPFLIRRFRGEPQGDLGSYARRRAFRILPAYWFALTIIAFVLRAPGFEDGQSIVAKYLLLHVYDLNQVVGGPIQQAWTLSTEVAFYVFLPIWAWLVGRKVRSPERQLRVELWSLAALWGGAMALKVIVVLSPLTGPQVGWLGCWLPLRLDEFALGMGLAVLSAWVSVKGVSLPGWLRGSPGVALFWVGAAVAFTILCFGFDLPLDLSLSPSEFLGSRVAFSFIALAFLIPIVLGRQDHGPVPVLLGNRLMVWLGLVSFGVYIWHEAWQLIFLRITGDPELNAPVLSMLVFTVGASLITAAISFYLVERPGMELGRRTTV